MMQTISALLGFGVILVFVWIIFDALRRSRWW